MVAELHHRFRGFDSLVVSVSTRGAAAPRAGAAEVNGQCFAEFGQSAVALPAVPRRQGRGMG